MEIDDISSLCFVSIFVILPNFIVAERFFYLFFPVIFRPNFALFKMNERDFYINVFPNEESVKY